MNNKADFSKGSVAGNIISLAVPLMFSQLITLLYNIVDRIYIGRIPLEGSLALTGLGLCFPIITMISAFANLYSFGGAPLFSIARGKGEDEEAGYIQGNALSMIIITSVFFMLFFLIFKKSILYMIGASDITYKYANEYLIMYLLGTIFSMTTLGMNYFLNAQGMATQGMIISGICAVINICLDPVFIFYLGMGVMGAALVSVISQLISAIWTLWLLCGEKAIIPITKKYLKISYIRIKKILALGLSGFIVAFTNSATQVACTSTLSLYGGDLYVGVMTILNSVREIASLPVVGIVDGASPVISYNYGAGVYDRVKKSIMFMTVSCVVYTSLSWAIIFFFPELFVKIFTSETELIKASIPSLKLFFFGFFMMAFQFSGQKTFVSLGKAKHSVFFSIFRKIIIVVPLTLLLPRMWGLGVNGVFIAEPVSNFVGGLCCFVTMLLTVLPEIREKENN